MFDALGERLQVIFRTLRGHGHLTENEIREGLREIRTALLEADVDLSVVRDFTEAVRQRAATDENRHSSSSSASWAESRSIFLRATRPS